MLKTGYDLVDLRWPADVLDALGVAPGALPDVVATGTQVATVSAAGADASGIPEGTPCAPGMTDGCAGAGRRGGPCRRATGAPRSGTTLVLKGSTRELLRDPEGAVYCHRNPDGGLAARRRLEHRGGRGRPRVRRLPTSTP